MIIFHNVDMFDMRAFSIKIDPDPLGARLFRWSLFEGDHLLLRSQFSYATRREAKDGAGAEMRKRSICMARPVG